MQRIPNPVSDLDTFLRIFREIHDLLKTHSDFGLDQISNAMISSNNVTSQGAIGNEALRRSTRKNRSRDPLYNQSKMYAELFRTLGWIQSTTSKLTYSFSLLGEHIANARNPAPLFQECLLGIAYPNEVLGVQTDQTVRVIGGVLLAMDSLGYISRDEMIAGPLSIDNDSDLTAFNNMLGEIAQCRKSPGKLDQIIDVIATKRKISRKPTMENYTRFPVAAFPWSGWGVKKARGVIQITDEGKIMANKLRSAPDIRLSQFNALQDTAKPAFIRWSFYSMLARAGFNTQPIKEILDADTKILTQHGLPVDGDIFFSPFQQLSRQTLKKWTPELVSESNNIINVEKKQLIDQRPNIQTTTSNRSVFILELSEHVATIKNQSSALLTEIRNSVEKFNTLDEATNSLFLTYNKANKDIFYPLVANLFCILGFDCHVSRSGQNYERADAIILDSQKSIPIEIKSPGEEPEISVKGVRQALENKVILLSRKSYPTDLETTSLLVGFNPPNARSEVHELVEDIRKTFGIRVGVIDFKSLLSLAVHSVHSGKQINFRNFHLIQGVLRVERLATIQ